MSYVETFSYSKAWTYNACKRKYSYQYKLRLRPLTKDAHLDSWSRLFTGTCIHAALEALSLGEDPAKYIADAIAEEKARGLREEQLDVLGIIEAEALMIATNFSEWFDMSQWEVVKHPTTGKPLVEFELRVPLKCGGEFLGYVDCVLRHKKTGKVVCSDYKTKKTLSPHGDEDFVTQLVLYLAALSKLGIVHANDFQLLEMKSSLPKRAPRKARIDTESIDAIRESEDGCFQVIPRYCSDTYIANVWEAFETQAANMMRFQHQYEYPNRSSFNCKGCPYRRLCDAQLFGEHIEDVLADGFETNLQAKACLL